MAKALGKGLSALLGNSVEGRFQSEKIYRIPVSAIHPDPEQPRREMDEEGLASLAESVKLHGILQPLLLKASGEEFRIVAGERRWRAARTAGLEEVPARIVDLSEASLREISLIENIQREDLAPLEVAAALQTLIKSFDLTQEDIAGRIGWSRAAVTNRLRLLNLPDEVKEMLAEESLSEGHARALLALKTPESIIRLARQAQDGRMTVRQLEAAIRADKEEGASPPGTRNAATKLRLSPGVQKLAATHGIKVQAVRRGDTAKIVLDNLKGIDETKLTEILEAFLKKL